MSVEFAVTLRDDIASELRDQLNAALGSAGTLDFFDGAQPLTCEDADAGTLLATLALSATVFDVPTANAFIANAIAMGGGLASGTATYWRMKDSGGTVVVQGNCNDTGTPNILFDSVSWSTSFVIQVTSLDFTVLLFGSP